MTRNEMIHKIEKVEAKVTENDRERRRWGSNLSSKITLLRQDLTRLLDYLDLELIERLYPSTSDIWVKPERKIQQKEEDDDPTKED